jgi:hypothetical protein
LEEVHSGIRNRETNANLTACRTCRDPRLQKRKEKGQGRRRQKEEEVIYTILIRNFAI